MSKLLERAFKKPSTPYTANSWENDAFLDPNPERAKKVSAESLATLANAGVKPEQLINPTLRKKYMEFLAKK